MEPLTDAQVALQQLCKTCKLNESEGYCEYYSKGLRTLCMNYTRKTGKVAASPAPATSALNSQVGGEHYKKLGAYQPWEVLAKWMSPEELKGFMKGTVISYLAREQDKNGIEDIKKAGHTIQLYLELSGSQPCTSKSDKSE